jgi:hypothetical protein
VAEVPNVKLSFITALIGLLGLTFISSGSLFVHLGMYLFLIAALMSLIGYWLADKKHVVAKIKSGANYIGSSCNRCKQYYRTLRTRTPA